MNYATLSLTQTPPLAVPLRYFLTAPLFAALAGLLLLLSPETLLSRWTPHALAATHLLTLGFLAMTMFGALQQLLPVLVGVALPRPELFSRTVHLLLSAGVVLLTTGMGSGATLLLQGGTVLLLLAVALFIGVVGHGLWHARSAHATVWAMAAALLALLITVLFGAGLLWRFGWRVPLIHPLTELHLAWGVAGWIALLLIGVAYQVVPMFQITPEYPRPLRRWLVPLLLLGLLLWSGARLWFTGSDLLLLPVAALLLLFAALTLRLQQQRRRRLPDVTLSFWRVAMVSLAAGVALLLLPGDHALAAGVLLLVGFAISAVSGMLYKIVPFLIWLHLNNRLQQSGSWQGRVPNMKQIIAEAAARRHYRLHLLTLGLLLLATFWPLPLARAAGAALLVSSLVLGWNLLQGVKLYRAVLSGVTA